MTFVYHENNLSFHILHQWKPKDLKKVDHILYQTFDLCCNRQKKYHFNFIPTFLQNVAYMLPRPMSLWSITSKEANVGICTL